MYRDYGPRGVKFVFVYKSLAHPELEGNYVQPFTMGERLAHARQAVKQLGASIPWIVDPMDGTKEFTRKIPEFGVSIALVEAGEPVVGVIFNPAADVAVWASRGDGCFRDGRRVSLSKVERLSDAVVLTFSIEG